MATLAVLICRRTIHLQLMQMFKPQEMKFQFSLLHSLKRRRGGNVGYVKKIFAEVSQLTEQSRDESNIEAAIFANKEILLEKEKTLKDYHEQIMTLLEREDDIAAEIEVHSNFSIEIRKSLYLVDKHFKKDNCQPESPHTKLNNSARLPRLNLKTFDGNPLAFQPFWDIFKSTVHNNKGIDEVSKFNYLKSLLEGKAKACLLGLDTTSENYKHAIDLLHERFGDPQNIINAHMDSLLSLRQVKTDNVEQLREIYDVIEIHTRGLTSFDISTKNYGPILNSIVMSKLPHNIKLDISRQMPSGKWDIVKLMDVFKRELVARERCEIFENLSVQDNWGVEKEEGYSTLYTTSHKTLYCTYCNKDHTSNRCHIVTDIVARKALLREQNRCYNCLRPGHTVNTCFSKYVCYFCKGKHRISICSKKSTRGEEQVIKPVTDHTLVINTQNNTLLQTAIASVNNTNDPSYFKNVRMLFDNCSQKSFITSELREHLKLKTIRTEVLTMKTFGNSEEKIQKLDVVNINISSTIK